MSTSAEQLRTIKTFPSLVKYLRDELEWPIESGDFDDLTFEYLPEELGLDTKTAAKIKEIKQLRPLEGNQPWGIFFINFEPKSLPVIALRRILSHLVIKKRKSSNRSERPAWAPHDLLFISSYGEVDHRDITFAQFSDDATDLPSLRVLSWDDEDTAAHLVHAHDTLKGQLRWPDNTADLASWRKSWSSAFTLKPREVVNTSKALAVRLAELATVIRKRVNKILEIESEKGPLRTLHVSFKEALIHDLKEDDFADMYAQTITYGLLSARVSRPAGLVAENIADMVPVTNPFLRDLLSTFLTIGGRKGKIDFDEVGINEVVQVLREANMEAVLRDFGDRNPQEDPVVHFYELFLKEYDPKKRMQRGVFYTPRPVVSYIVRSVDEILRKEFGLVDGLADTATWGQMVKSHPEIKIPEGARAEDTFVQILDPATGTGTFLVEVIDTIYKTMTAKWQGEGHSNDVIKGKWNEYVPDNLLPRLYGFELMMAPYAVAHMKMGLKLHDTGYDFKSRERARIYLTNALEPAHGFSGQLELDAPSLAHEAQAVNDIKLHKRFTVVIGNPPYSQMSQNLGEQERALVAPYRFIDGARIQERGAITFERNLQDDYIKFIRLSEIYIIAAGAGVCGIITNHAFLANITLRGMRAHLLSSFNRIAITDLHGNSKIHEEPPGGELDENVFDIQQGVAVSLMSKNIKAGSNAVTFSELWGSCINKYQRLGTVSKAIPGQVLLPQSPNYLLVARDNDLAHEYEVWPKLNDIMPLFGSAITTARDNVVVDFEDEEIVQRVNVFQDASMSDANVLSSLSIGESSIWSVADARKRLNSVPVKEYLTNTSYRPFDTRRLFYHDALISSPRHPTMHHMKAKNSIALAVCRQQCVSGFQHVFVSTTIFDEGLVSNRSREKTVAFPLYLTEDDEGQLFKCVSQTPNLNPKFITQLLQQLDLKTLSNGKGTLMPRGTFGADDMLHYTYAVLHSVSYRLRYEAFLKTDFPRLPLTVSLELVRVLAHLGGELVALHLLESPKLDKPITKWRGTTPSSEVEKITYSDETVWIDKAKTEGFEGVPEPVWNFHIGGYQVCEKWLKDRKGRKLSKEDIDHYQKIVVALNETIRLMKEIDKAIETHGGWPAAFITSKPNETA